MKFWIKGICAFLAVLLSFSVLLSASAMTPSPLTVWGPSLESPPATEGTEEATPPPTTEETVPTATEASVPATTEAATLPATEITSPPATEVTDPPATEITTPPETQVTVPPATEVTTPPATVPTAPPETEAPTQPTETPTEPVQPELPDYFASQSAFVYHCNSSTVLFTLGDWNARMYPASITKLFSCYVALKYLSPDTLVTAGDILDTVPWDSSKAGLEKGDTLTVEQLLYGMLLPSGGDAARVLAAAAGRVIAKAPGLSDAAAMEAFVAEMNRQADLSRMTSTHFTNPDGYHDPDHYTTLKDLLTLGTLSLSSPLISKVASTASIPHPLSDTGKTWENTNWLLNEAWQYYHPNAIGLKTGNTSAAGSCLLSAFQIGQEIYLIGTFGSTDYFTRFEDTLYLYDTYVP